MRLGRVGATYQEDTHRARRRSAVGKHGERHSHARKRSLEQRQHARTGADARSRRADLAQISLTYAGRERWKIVRRELAARHRIQLGQALQTYQNDKQAYMYLSALAITPQNQRTISESSEAACVMHSETDEDSVSSRNQKTVKQQRDCQHCGLGVDTTAGAAGWVFSGAILSACT
eukprot:6192904-Pleurochrysis_carterae.AAC.3